MNYVAQRKECDRANVGKKRVYDMFSVYHVLAICLEKKKIARVEQWQQNAHQLNMAFCTFFAANEPAHGNKKML